MPQKYANVQRKDTQNSMLESKTSFWRTRPLSVSSAIAIVSHQHSYSASVMDANKLTRSAKSYSLL